jgi:hypothetical protein
VLSGAEAGLVLPEAEAGLVLQKADAGLVLSGAEAGLLSATHRSPTQSSPLSPLFLTLSVS